MRRLLETELHNFKSTAVILAIKLFKKWSFILAVRAPAASNRNPEGLARKFGVLTRNQLAVEIGKTELQRLIGILQLRVMQRVVSVFQGDGLQG